MNITGKWWNRLEVNKTYKDFDGCLFTFKGIKEFHDTELEVGLRFEIMKDCFYGLKENEVVFYTEKFLIKKIFVF